MTPSGALLSVIAHARRNGSRVLAGGLVGVLIGLVLGQMTLVRIADARLHDYNRNLLQHAVAVAMDSRAALSIVNAADAVPCSDIDLDNMRRLSFKSEHLRDIGRLKDGRIICTALWGRLPAPIALPPPQRRQHDDDILWRGISAVRDLGIPVDVAGRHSAVVFTSPAAFRPYESEPRRVDAQVVTRDGRHVYREFGDGARLGAPTLRAESPFDLGPVRETSACDADLDVCAAAAVSGVSILSQPVPLLIVILLGALTGGSMALAALLYRQSRASLAQWLRRALADGQLQVVYQPLVRVEDQRMVGVEALARLATPGGDQIPTEHVIRVAEDSGQIGDVTRLVLQTALRDMSERLQQDPAFHLGVNVSVSDVLHPAFADDLDREAAKAGVPSTQIVLELTERSTAERARLIECMAALRARGYNIFIDDFGTGYSSLGYLAQLPINGVKIDRIFTQAIGTDAVGAVLIENICALADRFGFALVVEGIETPSQAAHLRALHPQAIGQGWLYGRPAPADHFRTGA